MRSADQTAKVADVAEAAGLAKGTVYRYFASKEELLLALHERTLDRFFSVLIERLEKSEAPCIDDLRRLAHKHIIARPIFLPLAARCLSSMGESTPAGFELPKGGGGALLQRSYALIVGLWQLFGAEGCPAPLLQEALHAFSRSYADNVSAALHALWRGTIGIERSVHDSGCCGWQGQAVVRHQRLESNIHSS